MNCGQDEEGRFEINVEKDLVELTVQSVSKNTKEKLHSFLHRGKPESFFFSNEIFEKLGKSLGVERKTSAQNNLCWKPKKADVISVSIENDLWKSNILGSDNPETLLRTTFYLIGLNFGMRAGDDARKLSAKFAKLANSFTRDYVTPDDKYLFGVEIIDSCSVCSGATQGWTANPPTKKLHGSYY